jgi:hypothetical protein
LKTEAAGLSETAPDPRKLVFTPTAVMGCNWLLLEKNSVRVELAVLVVFSVLNFIT